LTAVIFVAIKKLYVRDLGEQTDILGEKRISS
jgi:hypothetical protein